MNDTFDDDLSSIAIQFRGEPWELASRVPRELRVVVVSRFCIWLLEESWPILKTDEQRELSSKIKALHERRLNGQEIDPTEWEQSRAGSLYATRLWPPEWLSCNSIPSHSPLGRSVMAAVLALRVRRPEHSTDDIQNLVRDRLILECNRALDSLDQL